MKKIKMAFTCLLVALFSAFSLVGCTVGEKKDTTPSDSGTNNTSVNAKTYAQQLYENFDPQNCTYTYTVYDEEAFYGTTDYSRTVQTSYSSSTGVTKILVKNEGEVIEYYEIKKYINNCTLKTYNVSDSTYTQNVLSSSDYEAELANLYTPYGALAYFCKYPERNFNEELNALVANFTTYSYSANNSIETLTKIIYIGYSDIVALDPDYVSEIDEGQSYSLGIEIKVSNGKIQSFSMDSNYGGTLYLLSVDYTYNTAAVSFDVSGYTLTNGSGGELG